jgi:DNA processing protein
MSDVRYWIGFSLIPHIGAVRVRRLLAYFGDLSTAWQADAASLRAAGLPKDALERLLYVRPRLDLDAELARITSAGAQVLTWESPDYPALLQNIEQPPPVLYVRGSLSSEDRWAVAVVGTRSPSAYGKQVTQQIASGLARNGITVVSGLAFGIDSVAHRAALEAGGRTLAVLGTGVDLIYPERHRELAGAIIEQGALISDYCLGTKPDATNFPPRNRIISGLSLGTLVVEAGIKSGALITLEFALEQGRETFAVPGNVYNASSAGTNGAIQRGEAKLVTRVEDILSELNLTMVAQQSEVREIVPESAAEQALLACLGNEPILLDELVHAAGLPTATVSSTLCMMELKGMVRRVDNMSYVLAY